MKFLKFYYKNYILHNIAFATYFLDKKIHFY